MTYAQYVYSGPVGTGRGGVKNRTGPTLWVVLHTSEGGEGINAAENLASFMRGPATANNVASYQAVTDTDRVLRMMDDGKRANSASGANEKAVHICFPGKVSQTRDQWLDTVSSGYITQAALAVADWCDKYAIPPVRITPKDLLNNTKGICDHNDVRLAFGKTTHTDVGPNFPWDVFLSRLLGILEPVVPTPPNKIVEESMRYQVFKLGTDAYHFGLLGEWWRHLGNKTAINAVIAGGATDLKTGTIVKSWGDVQVMDEATVVKIMGTKLQSLS